MLMWREFYGISKQKNTMYNVNHCAEGILPTTDNLPGDSYWCGSDSEELFKKTSPIGWNKKSIIYRFNSYGYRTAEFDFASTLPNILCLGCSNTEGTGNKEEDIWPTKLKDFLPQYNVYNLGVGGASNDTITRILTNTRPIFNPTHVFILWTHFNRFESYHTSSEINPPIRKHGSWDQGITPDTLFLYDDPQGYNNFNKNNLLVYQLSKNYNFKLYELRFDMLKQFSPIDFGRDMKHLGPLWHKYVADEFIRAYNN